MHGNFWARWRGVVDGALLGFIFVALVLIQAPIAARAAEILHVAVLGDDATGDGSEQSPFASIQKGIDLATTGSLVLVGPGTYVGALNRNLDFQGKPIALRSEAGASSTTIDAQNQDRVFNFHSNETSETAVQGFTIKHGFAPIPAQAAVNSPPTRGGGILCDHASPLFTDCVITSNTAHGNNTLGLGQAPGTGGEAHGGGIYLADSSAIFIRCEIQGNLALGGTGGLSSGRQFASGVGGSAYGGGIYCTATGAPQFTDCLISGNTSLGGFNTFCTFSPSNPDPCTTERVASQGPNFYGCGDESPPFEGQRLYILGRWFDTTGLDVNSDGAVDIADLYTAAISQ